MHNVWFKPCCSHELSWKSFPLLGYWQKANPKTGECLFKYVNVYFCSIYLAVVLTGCYKGETKLKAHHYFKKKYSMVACDSLQRFCVPEGVSIAHLGLCHSRGGYGCWKVWDALHLRIRSGPVSLIWSAVLPNCAWWCNETSGVWQYWCNALKMPWSENSQPAQQSSRVCGTFSSFLCSFSGSSGWMGN